MTEADSERGLSTDDARLHYEAPELVDCGEVADVTQTGASNLGADGIYS